MNIFDPHITGSLSVSASAEIQGDLTVQGTIYGTAQISGTVENSISTSHAASYLLTSSFNDYKGTAATTGSNVFIGDQTISGSLLPQGTLTHDLGSDTKRWNDIYLAGSTIDIGGTKISKNSDGNIQLHDSGNTLKKLIASEIELGHGSNKKVLKVDNGRLKLMATNDTDEELVQLTGSFSGDGSGLFGIQASGVTGLSLDRIASSTATASISSDSLITNVSIIPSITNTIDLGAPDKEWRDLYLSSGSLYINGQQVLSTTGTELRVTTDGGESIKILETGSDTITLQSADGDITLSSSGTGNIELDAPIQITAGNKIISSDGNSIVFGNGLIVTGSIELTGTVDGVDVGGLKSTVDDILDLADADKNSFSEIVELINSVDTTNDEAFAAHYTASNNRFTSLETTSGSHDGRLDSLETKSGSLTTDIKSKLNSENVVSGSEFVLNSTSPITQYVNIIVTAGGGFYSIDGIKQQIVSLAKGLVYRFDVSDSSNSGHPFRFSLTNNNQYTDGVTVNGTEGSSGAYVQIIVNQDTPQTLLYYCTNHNGMGNKVFVGGAGDTDSITEGTTNLYYTDDRVKTKLNTETVISGSVQVDITGTTNYNLVDGRLGSLESFTSSIDDTYATDADVTTLRGDLNTYTSSNDSTNTTQNSRLGSLETKTGSLDTDISNLRGDLNTYTTSNETDKQNLSGRIDSLETKSGSLDGDISTLDGRVDSLETESGSVRTTLNTYTSSNDGRLDSIETKTGSLDGDISTLDGRVDSIETKTGSLSTDISNLSNRADALEEFTSSIDDTYATDADVTTLRNDLNTYTSSNNTTNQGQDLRLVSLEIESGSVRTTLNTYTSSNDGTNTTQNNRLDSIETTSGSHDGRLDSLETKTGSLNGDIGGLDGRLDTIEGGLEFTGSNVTIKGNLLVRGTETRVNSTTVDLDDNILSLNGTGASDAGIEVRDVTSPGILSGSLLWDGSTNYWKGGTKGNEERLLDNTDLTTLDSRLDGIEAETGSYQDGYEYSQIGHLPLSGGTISGHIIPSIDATQDLGTTNSQDFRTLYVRNIEMYNQRVNISSTGTLATITDHTTVGDGIQFSHLGAEILRLGNGSSTTSTFAGTIVASGYNDGNWNTAYGWGDHSQEGYITGFTNTNEFVTGATFNSSNGVVTFTRNNGGDTFNVDIDGRFLTSYSETDTLSSVTLRGAITNSKITIGSGGAWTPLTINKSSNEGNANAGVAIALDGTDYSEYGYRFKANGNNYYQVLYDGSAINWKHYNSGYITKMSLSNGGNLTATSFIKSGGTSSQFLKADGSVDSNTYLTQHPPIASPASSNNSGRTYIQDILLDGNGHVTGLTTATETVTDSGNDNYYVDGVEFNLSTGVFTASVNGSTNQTVDLDGRYVKLGGDTMTGDISAPSFIGKLMGGSTGAPDATIWCVSGQYTDWGIFYDEGNPDKILFKSSGNTKASIALDNGNINTSGTVTASGGNSGNWNTAYGWGDHSTEGYITGFTNTNEFTTGATFNSGDGVITFTRNNGGDTFTVDITGYSETDTLDSVTDRGATTSNVITVGGVNLNDSNSIIEEASGNAFRFKTSTGYIDIGSKNTGWIHFEGNRPYYFGTSSTAFDGDVRPYSNNVRNLGSTSYRWAGIYANGGDSSQWNTAYGWGDHSTENYLKEYNDEYTTGATWNGGTGIVTFTRNDGDTYSVDISSALTEVTVTGGTYNDGTQTLTLTKSDGTTVDVTGFALDNTNNFTTGATFNTGNGVITGTRNGGDTWTVDIDNRYLQLGGGTISSSNTYSLKLENTTNGGGTGIEFSDNPNSGTQRGYITHYHSDGGSYGSGASMVLSTTETSFTVLVDGKLMYKEGIYTKPASGTAAGTRKDTNWDTAYGWGDHASGGYLSTSGKAADSELLDGLDLHTGRNNEANKVVRTDGNGYANFGWINTTSGNNGTNTINRIYASGDGYIRYYTPSNFISGLGLVTTSGYNKTNWDTAYGWGDHSTEGYTGDQDLSGLLPISGGTLTGNLSIDIPDQGGAPAMTALFNMRGYEGRGVGIKMKDNVNSASGSTDREWFVGTGYNTTGFNIGYASDGSQSSYPAQSKLSISTSGNVVASGTLTATNLSGTNTGDQDLSGYLLNTTDTFTGSLTVNGNIRGAGQHLILNAGESYAYATGQGNEYVYVNAEQGLEVNSETGNWTGGWAARKTALLRGDLLRLDGEDLTKTNIQNFKTAYGWGDHSTEGYIKGFTNTNEFVTGATFNTGNGIITFTRNNGGGTFNVDIDGRYAPTAHDHNFLAGSTSNTGSSGMQNWNSQESTLDLNPTTDWYTSLRIGHGDPVAYYSNTLAIQMTGGDSGRIYTRTVANGSKQTWKKYWHDGDFSSSNISNWSTAYGWGDHSTEGYVKNDEYTTGATFNGGNGIITFTRNDGDQYTVDISSTLTDVTVTGGTYNGGNQTLTLTKSDGNTVDVTGFAIDTVKHTTGATFNSGDGVVTFTKNNGDTYTVDIDGRYGLKSLSENKTYTSGGNAVGSYLGGHYSGGGTEKPNSATFGSGKLKIAMLSNTNLGFGGSWNDVLWISAYNGSDVKGSHALVFDKYSSNVYVSDQSYDSASWGTGYQLWHTGHFQQSSINNWNTAYGWGDHSTAGYASGDFLLKSGGTMTGGINMNGSGIDMVNGQLSNVNHITIADPGPTEGIEWLGGNGFRIVESPNDLTTNSGGNLQFVKSSTRILTLGSNGQSEFTDKLTLTSSTSGSTIFDIQGTSGQLFSITDDLTGDLFAVSDSSGVPIFNVNANGAVSIHSLGTLEVGGSQTVTGSITAGSFIKSGGTSSQFLKADGSVDSTTYLSVLPSHTHTFASLTSKPTTLSGYGITDALPLAGGTMSGDIIFNDNIRLEYSTTHHITPRDSSGNMHLSTTTGGIYLDSPVIYIREKGSESNKITINNGTLVATGTIGGSNFSGTSSGTNTGDQDLSGLTGDQDLSGYATFSGSNSFTNSYNEFGNGTGSVSNDGSWNARVNIAGSSHARLDVKSVSDGIITSIYSHTGNGAGKMGTMSNHPLKLMVNGSDMATLNSSGNLSLTGTISATNFSGTSSGTNTGDQTNISGNAATATSADMIDGQPFKNTTSNSGQNADTIASNGISYYTSGVVDFTGNASDGALYSQAYSSSWQHQIAGDYRSGRIAVRGKNSGTWQSWKKIPCINSTTFSNVKTVSFTHGLGTDNCIVQLYDDKGNLFFPSIINVASGVVTVSFETNRSGRLHVTG